MELPAFKQQQPQQKCEWNLDVFQSVLGINNAKIIYSIDKNTIVKINAKDLKIDDNINKNMLITQLTLILPRGKTISIFKLQITAEFTCSIKISLLLKILR